MHRESPSRGVRTQSQRARKGGRGRGRDLALPHSCCLPPLQPSPSPSLLLSSFCSCSSQSLHERFGGDEGVRDVCFAACALQQREEAPHRGPIEGALLSLRWLWLILLAEAPHDRCVRAARPQKATCAGLEAHFHQAGGTSSFYLTIPSPQQRLFPPSPSLFHPLPESQLVSLPRTPTAFDIVRCFAESRPPFAFRFHRTGSLHPLSYFWRG